MKGINKMKKATIYDYARMCKFYEDCTNCPIAHTAALCNLDIVEQPDRANEIILKWCKEHPIKTRQSEFLKMFPNARTCNGVIDICPISFGMECSIGDNCSECEKEYWLAEVEENE